MSKEISLSGYSILAPVYDKLNDTVDYSLWADYIEECFKKFSPEKEIKSVLELGCGTGSMTLELARRGYDMTALDISEEMLSVAENRVREAGLKDVLFVESDMCGFELYGTVDAVICCLDGINHLLSREELLECFALVIIILRTGSVRVWTSILRTNSKPTTQTCDYLFRGRRRYVLLEKQTEQKAGQG